MEDIDGGTMEDITVTIRKVVPFVRGGGVITAYHHEKKKTVRILSPGNARVLRNGRYRRFNRSLPVLGEVYVVTGKFEYHRTYRLQFIPIRFKIQKQVEAMDNTNVLIYLRNAEQFRNIALGPAKIKALDDAFPNGRLARVLETNDVNELMAVPGISEMIARRVLAGWHGFKAESDLMAYLDVNGFDRRLSRKLINAWGVEAKKHLDANPYRMLAFEHDWSKVDRYARKIKVAEDDERRYVAAVAQCLWVAMDREGHTLAYAQALREGVSALLHVDLLTADKAIQMALTKEVIKGDAATGYQPVGAYAMEKAVAKRIREIQAQSFPRQPALTDWNDVTLEFIEARIAEYEVIERKRLKKPRFKLTDKQKLAVISAVVGPVCLLTGYAGCGKTTVIRAVFYVVHAMNAEIYQMAVAGRAVQRMRDTSDQEAYTLVGFINRLITGEITIRSTPLIVIDESSMVDLPLIYWLLGRLRQDVRLLFVGDPAQLPPVSFGLVFHRLVDAAKLNVSDSPAIVELDYVFRQDETTGIPMIAKAIREGNMPVIPEYCGLQDGVSFIECERQDIPQEVLDTLLALGGPGRVQVLGSMKDGAAGVHALNRICREYYTPQQDDSFVNPYGEIYSVGSPVIYLKNDYEHRVWNGSLGHVLAIDSVVQTVTCQFDDKVTYVVDRDNLRNLELAYAITTHKAQGSQFDVVIVPVHGKNPLLDRSLIYTALTRGVKQVVFIGEHEAFARAVTMPPKAELRQVGFWKI